MAPASSKADDFDGAKKCRQAGAIVERLLKKVIVQCPGIEDTPFLKTGEAWFVWGLFTAMTSSDQRSESLLRTYLHNKHGLSDVDAAAHARCIAHAASLNSPLFNAVSHCGNVAYQENDDEQLVRIAQTVLRAMTMAPRP